MPAARCCECHEINSCCTNVKRGKNRCGVSIHRSGTSPVQALCGGGGSRRRPLATGVGCTQRCARFPPSLLSKHCPSLFRTAGGPLGAPGSRDPCPSSPCSAMRVRTGRPCFNGAPAHLMPVSCVRNTLWVGLNRLTEPARFVAPPYHLLPAVRVLAGALSRL